MARIPGTSRFRVAVLLVSSELIKNANKCQKIILDFEKRVNENPANQVKVL